MEYGSSTCLRDKVAIRPDALQGQFVEVGFGGSAEPRHCIACSAIAVHRLYLREVFEAAKDK